MMILGGLNLNLPLSPYCRAHVCGQEGCAEPAAANGGSRYCLAHARCRRPGCMNGVEVR
ncbi:hypothetical protein BDP55DRAFT_701653, partial [Colletotrichum godetiae]